ncbi:MAG: hypothetical protein ABSA40_02050 [Candidatus Dormibacteria bacterium]|jgi:hypothetical protein
MPDAPVPDLDSIAASLHADAADTGIFFQVLCSKLLATMPGSVEVQREGGLFRKKDAAARRIVVHAGDDVFEAELQQGTVACRRQHAVRGIVLHSDEMGFDAWLTELVNSLGRHAEVSSAASAALRSLVT